MGPKKAAKGKPKHDTGQFDQQQAIAVAAETSNNTANSNRMTK